MNLKWITDVKFIFYFKNLNSYQNHLAFAKKMMAAFLKYVVYLHQMSKSFYSKIRMFIKNASKFKKPKINHRI